MKFLFVRSPTPKGHNKQRNIELQGRYPLIDREISMVPDGTVVTRAQREKQNTTAAQTDDQTLPIRGKNKSESIAAPDCRTKTEPTAPPRPVSSDAESVALFTDAEDDRGNPYGV